MSKIKLQPGKVLVRNENFRANTQTEMKECVFSMMEIGKDSAAMGDMICWLTSIKFVAENYNYIQGHLIVPYWFIEVAANIMREYPHWRVHSRIPERLSSGAPLRCPSVNPVNATMMHLVDLGFIYFAGMLPPNDEARNYPELNLEDVGIHGAVADLKGNYVVMTPGTTALTRMMLPSAFNGAVDHLLKLGITPVFLGTESMDRGKRPIAFNEAYRLDLGLNLIGKTSLMEAAKIMEGAKFVMGIDNGLLHLAGMTDVPIVFGYTMAGPNQRRIYRQWGTTVEVHADKKMLPCLFCQEHVRFFDHSFTQCLYKEYEPMCVRALNADTWVANIDYTLREACPINRDSLNLEPKLS